MSSLTKQAVTCSRREVLSASGFVVPSRIASKVPCEHRCAARAGMPGSCASSEHELCGDSRQAAAKPLPPRPAPSQDAHPGFFAKLGGGGGSDDPSPSTPTGIPSAAQPSGQRAGSENRPQPSQPGSQHVPQRVRGRAHVGRRPLAPIQTPHDSQQQPGGELQARKQHQATQPCSAAAAAGDNDAGVEQGVVLQDSLNEGQRTAVQRCHFLHRITLTAGPFYSRPSACLPCGTYDKSLPSGPAHHEGVDLLLL